MTKPTLPGDPHTARLAEQQMEELRAEIERLKAQLAAQAPVMEAASLIRQECAKACLDCFSWEGGTPEFCTDVLIGCGIDRQEALARELNKLIDAHAEMEKGDG